MAAPKTAIQRFDLAMSYQEYSALAQGMGYVGLQVLPPIGVAKKESSYARIPTAALKAPVKDDKRAPRSGYLRDDFEWEDDSYTTDEHGREADVDDAEIEMYGDILDVEMIARDRTVLQLLDSYEAAVGAAVFNTAVWTGASLTTAVAAKWDAAGQPVTDGLAAKNHVEDNCNFSANSAIVPKRTLQAFAHNSQVKDYWKSLSGNDAPMPGYAELFARVFDLQNVIVPGAYKNTADRGQDAVLSKIWPITMCMFCRISPSRDVSGLDPRIGNTFMWNEQNMSIPGLNDPQLAMIMEEYREEARRGGVIRNRCNYGLKIHQPECGHLLTAVL